MAEERIYDDPEWLRARYVDDRMTMAAIAELAGCYPMRIYEALRRHQIPTRSRGESRDKKIDRACEQCGKPMQVKRCLIEKGFGRFCSRACKHADAKRLTKAEEVVRAKAREILNSAVVRGKILRPDRCESCGAERPLEGHHPDYSKPLVVEWLCVKCHKGRHREAA